MRIVVAMSGGVDSSVAAALLVSQGHDVVGVSMQLYDAAPSHEGGVDRFGSCCSIDDLHETALKNLVGKSESIAAHAAQDEQGQVYLILFQTMDGFDASRVLLPTLHERLREYLGSPFAAGIPNRDILLCFRNDDETVDKLRQQIGNDYLHMPHQVTDTLLLVTPDGLAPRD